MADAYGYTSGLIGLVGMCGVVVLSLFIQLFRSCCLRYFFLAIMMQLPPSLVVAFLYLWPVWLLLGLGAGLRRAWRRRR